MARPSAYDQLLHHVCVDLGFCGSVVDGQPRRVDLLVPQSGTVTANQFADLVFTAEGVVLERFREPLHDAFRRFLGSDVVDARSLR
jgi:hypothetical protein